MKGNFEEPETSNRPGGRRAGARGLAPLLVAGVVLVALATAYFVFFRTPGPARRGGNGEASRSIGVAVFPFRPAAGAAEVAWYGQAVAVFLPLALEEDLDLRVLTPERLHDLSRGNLPPELPGQMQL